MKTVRVVVVGGFLSYRALFQWLRPSLFVPTMLVTPVFQVLFFVYVGRFAGVADDRFYVVGNAVLGSAVAGLYGPMLAMSEERAAGALGAVLASPAGRIPIFVGRMLPYAINGLLVSCFTLGFAAALLGPGLPADRLPALLAPLVVAAFACAGLGLALGSLALISRDVPFLSNLVNAVMLLVCGANVAVPDLPWPLRAAGSVLPLTHGVQAAQRLADGASVGSVGWLLCTELGIGAGYVTLAVLLLARVERMARRAGTLDLR
ncbi:MAG TPA: ABC transporter permease [Streptosporangiaceae bacterium]|jgi:ABC-2 type transport system permease protein